MVLIFTDNEQLDRDLNKKIEDSRIVYYPDYVLEEKNATMILSRGLGMHTIPIRIFNPGELILLKIGPESE